MLISIKTKDSARLWRIPIPFHFAVNLFLRKGLILSIARMSSKDYDAPKDESADAPKSRDRAIQELEKWLDAVDLGKLRASIHELKAYKGVALVDVETKDGDIIKIVL